MLTDILPSLAVAAQTTPPATVAPPPVGEAQFYDDWQPVLPAQTYTITAGIAFNDGTGTIPSGLPTATQTVVVAGPHFALPPSAILSSQPPNNGNADYSETLPQVVLTPPSLPWLRSASSTAPAGTPWLALLLFAPDEITAPAGQTVQQNPTLAGTATVQDVVAPPSGYVQPTFSVLEASDDATATCSYVDLPLSTFTSALPALADLPFMAHARNVNVAGDVADGAQPGTPVAALIGSRLPQQGAANIVHLVSLQGYVDYLGGGSQTPSGTTVRLVSLASWSFQCQADVDFEGRVSALSTGTLSIPYTAPAAPAPAGFTQVSQALDGGYAPLNETMRQGEKTVSWYRGPLVPAGIPQAQRATAYYTSDAALIYDRTTGMFDESYAVAWQIGRLLALSSGAFSQQVLALRQSLSATVGSAALWSKLNTRFGAALPLSQQTPAEPLPLSFAKAATRCLMTSFAQSETGQPAASQTRLGRARDPHGLLSPRTRNRG